MIRHFKTWLALHKLLAAYCLFTILLSFIPAIKLENTWVFYFPKLIVFSIIFSWDFWSKKLSKNGLRYLNLLLGLGFLGFFYNETGQLNHLFFEPIDPFLVKIDEQLFGIQPSLWFSTQYSGTALVELMNLGYLSYYFIILGFLILAIYRLPQQFDYYLYLISQSFIIYYLFFIIVPSWGPQFYFSAPLCNVPEGTFFQKIIAFIQQHGEAATGAMPSSHVGIALIVAFIAYRDLKCFFWLIFPMVLVLLCSTVYIKAHYVVDVIAGIVSAPVVLYISHKIRKLLHKTS